MGRRHLAYFRQGFLHSYWDSFSVSLVEGIEAALLHEVEEEPSTEAEDEAWRTLYAWQKFIRAIIDQMRVAYLEESEVVQVVSPSISSPRPKSNISSRHSSCGSGSNLPLPQVSHLPPGIEASPSLNHLRTGSNASSTKNSRTSSYSSSNGNPLIFYSRDSFSHTLASLASDGRSLSAHQRRSLYQSEINEDEP